MDGQEVYDRVKKVVIHMLSVDINLVVPEAGLAEDLKADSLDLVELLMAIEDEFTSELQQAGLKSGIPDAEAEKLVRVGDVVDYIVALSREPAQ